MSDMSENPIGTKTEPGASTMIVQITTDKSGPKLVCPICSKPFVSLNGYVKHMKRHEPPGGFCCNVCDERFCLDEQLKKHKDEKHKVLACQICSMTFENDQEYRIHIKDIHNGVDRPMHVCDICGMEFKTEQAIKRHKSTQCGQIKPHKCDECEMEFYTKYTLAEHKKIHQGDKKFCCSYCGKSFLSNGRLLIHERTHTGEKPYKCDVCGKCFAHRESIVTHSSLHTGVKLVQCKCCGARFSCHSNLIKHRRTRADSCGLAIYNSAKGKKRNGSSRIPASLMTSEIKIVQASRVMNPKEEQKKPKKAQKPQKAAKATKAPKIESRVPQLDTDEEEVIVKRPRRSHRTEEPNQCDKIRPEAIKTDSDFGGDNFDDYPSFECDNGEISDNSSNSEKLDIKVADLNVLLEDSIKLKDEEDKLVLIPEEQPPIAVKEEIKEETQAEDQLSIKPCRVILEPLNSLLKSDTPKIDKRKPNQKRIKGLRKKLRIFKKDRTYNCDFCIKIYHIKKPYVTHLQQEHNKTDDEIRAIVRDHDDGIPDELVHRCPICYKIYFMAKRLQTHISLHGPEGKLVHKCPCYCSIYFRTKEEAIEHAKITHKELIYCSICDKYSQTAESMKIHKRSHTNRRERQGRNLICDKCAKSFASRTCLTDHIRSDCGRNPLYQCNMCSKNFTTAGILKTHLVLHKDDTPYMCDQCGKAFKVKSQYNSHLKIIHSDNKPFKCNQCDKAYPYRESLLTHMASHTGLKRFACTGCQKRFTCISNLQAHRKVYAETCGLQPLNSKPSHYMGVQKGLLLIGTKPTF